MGKNKTRSPVNATTEYLHTKSHWIALNMPSKEHEQFVEAIVQSDAKLAFASIENLHKARLLRLANSSIEPPKVVPDDIRISRDDDTLGYPLYTITPKLLQGKTADVLYIHGGGYIFQISERQWIFAFKVALTLGCRVFVPLYPLAPDHKGSETVPPLLKWWAKPQPGESSNRPITMYGIKH